ncbi:pseudouridine synthase [Stutzerimonas xanthomarina]|uniref:Pseudouridine synthase n=2 Tax=Stutzerimonas xanthomarina TaxID=271420 RepID=A0A1M5PRZ9_9GAMM|nr:pseudouridine synthase [Stutzerimonas xanthomarina]MCP9338269.1 rRNA pseudouridine synthase [Stutzerimonas xanthomarina]SEH71907.1 16S rRNA pseudouridine516 synthase [Stutzerimonas xanthomarina]SHH04568.1 16S rRNA pseudouridine516 synthase [Stutzerimonas xanthomarina DSM 18231]
MRLDRFLANLPHCSHRQARLLLASGRTSVNGATVYDGTQDVRVFDRIELDGQLLQAGKPARFFMLNKPAGCVSATADPRNSTVLDLLHEPDKEELHIAGRLDFNTTGLMIITNDGLWSRRLTQPQSLLGKTYLVETEAPIDPNCVDRFAQGLYFRFENLTTLPAELELLGSHQARLTLHEGRYHQVKRMFGHFNNKVTALHRERMGPLLLDDTLAHGHYRSLTTEEIKQI